MLTASFTDPGTDDTHTFLWQVVADNGQSVADGTNATFDFTPADDGTYTVTDQEDMASDVVVITADNGPPQNVDAGLDRMVNEGDTVGLTVTFFDPGTADTHTVDWVATRSCSQWAAGRASHLCPRTKVPIP